MDNRVTAEYLDRLKNCEFLPDEAPALLFNFHLEVVDALKPAMAEFWELSPDNGALLPDAKQLQTPEDFTNALNPKYVFAEQKRRWLRKGMLQIRPLVIAAGLDPTPLLWLSRYIHGTAELSAQDRRAILDLLDNLSYARLEPNDNEADADAAASGGDNQESPPLGKSEETALHFLALRYPVLCTLDDFNSANPSLSRATASKAVKTLISAGYANRPKGDRSGATATELGRATAAQISR